MKSIFKEWRTFLTEDDLPDTTQVVKLVLMNKDRHVLFLRRSNYVKKYAGELDLPGGHVKEGESLLDGLVREVEEETSLRIFRATLYTKKENIAYFRSIYEKGRVNLSNEHTEYEFVDVMTIENPSKFEKIAIEVVKDEQFR